MFLESNGKFCGVLIKMREALKVLYKNTVTTRKLNILSAVSDCGLQEDNNMNLSCLAPV
jgi:hypothetical protein